MESLPYLPVQQASPPLEAMAQLSHSRAQPTTAAKVETFSGRPRDRTPVSINESRLTATLLFVWQTLFLPVMGLIYLTFCYICLYRLVKVSERAEPLKHLPIIKAGVTTLSIIFVSLSLLPLSSLINELKSEEFFRVLSGRRQGSPLSAVNTVSTPSHGMRDSLATLYRRQGTRYFTGAFFASLIFLAASALAPAALSVDTVLFDGDIMAFSVGAVLQDSVLRVSNASRGVAVSAAANDQSRQSGSIAWAEVYLGVNYSFHSPMIDQAFYIVPPPVDLPINTSARWLSDVAVIRPTCEWIAPQFLNMSPNISTASIGSFSMVLPQTNVHVLLSAFDLQPASSQSITQLQSNWTGGQLDQTTNGASVWLMAKCVANCKFKLFEDDVEVAFGSGVPTSRYNSTDGYSVDMSFLSCEPNAEIQTRHVHNDGQGSLTFGETVPEAQGNLHLGQINLLLTYAFNGFERAGPTTVSNISGVGNEAQFYLIFGEDVGLNATRIFPQSIEDITKRYGQFLQSGTKKFVDGSLASAYVPGRATRQIAVFVSSLPHVIVSTILYVVLSSFVLVCYFRKEVPQFTFLAVSASLANSNIPALSSRLRMLERRFDQEGGDAAAMLGNARVVLEGDMDGAQVLRFRGHVPSRELDGDSSNSHL